MDIIERTLNSFVNDLTHDYAIDLAKQIHQYVTAVEEILATPKDWSDSNEKAYGVFVRIAAKP